MFLLYVWEHRLYLWATPILHKAEIGNPREEFLRGPLDCSNEEFFLQPPKQASLRNPAHTSTTCIYAFTP